MRRHELLPNLVGSSKNKKGEDVPVYSFIGKQSIRPSVTKESINSMGKAFPTDPAPTIQEKKDNALCLI
jgi:hypothetical protein